MVPLEGNNKVNPFQVLQVLSKFGTATHVYRHSEIKLEVVMSLERDKYHLLTAEQLSCVGEENR